MTTIRMGDVGPNPREVEYEPLTSPAPIVEPTPQPVPEHEPELVPA